MKDILFHMDNQARASEAIWKAVYVLGFEVETEEENTLCFKKKGLFGKERRLLFTFEGNQVFLEAESGDFLKLKKRLG